MGGVTVFKQRVFDDDYDENEETWTQAMILKKNN